MVKVPEKGRIINYLRLNDLRSTHWKTEKQNLFHRNEIRVPAPFQNVNYLVTYFLYTYTS